MERAKYVMSAVAAVVFAGVVTVSTTALSQEPATPVACGQVLTSSVRVANGLSECPGDGLIVGAADITIDLDGCTLDGTGLGAGVLNAGFDGSPSRTARSRTSTSGCCSSRALVATRSPICPPS